MAVTPGTPSSAEAATDNLLTGIQTPVKDEQTLMTVSVLMPTSDDTIVPLSGCFSPAILRKMTKTSTAPPISIPHSHPVKAHSSVCFFKATPHKDRLSALHAIFRQIFRHFRYNFLEIRQYSSVDFVNLTKNYARNLTHNLCVVLP